jgi:hypothetical protein
MCFGGGGSTNQDATDTSNDINARELIRQSDVKKGKANIDTNFAQFNDPYYQGYEKAYADNYVPQIDKQYTTNVGKMIAALAERGIDRSSIGASAQGNLYEDSVNAKAGVASDARSAADTLRSNVENTKSNLYAMNSASADPAAANAMALGQSKSLVAPPQYSPIGDVFASAMQPFTNGVAAANNAPGTPYKSPYSTNKSTGSGTVVR